MANIQCEWCKKWFDKPQKRINQTNKKGERHCCTRKCSAALTNEERKCEPTTPNATNTRKDKEKFPEKDRARYLVRQAVKSGKLIPSTGCEICYAEGKIEAHHPNHSRPYLLIYLCKNCHHTADADPDKWEDMATDYSGCII